MKGKVPVKKDAALFLDRDGTIIEDRGDLRDPSQVLFFDETLSSLQRLSKLFKLFIVTNQSGVARGTLSIEEVHRVNFYIEGILADHGINIVETYVCPHDPLDGCECRKPKPYFLKKAEKDYGVDLSRSFVVGDHPQDIEFGERVGAGGVYVLSGHGRKHLQELPPNTLIASGILEATETIIKLYQRMRDNH
jgi:D-glycero-D-manno-heptose 1,7-bisphosphate phosphatase